MDISDLLTKILGSSTTDVKTGKTTTQGGLGEWLSNLLNGGKSSISQSQIPIHKDPEVQQDVQTLQAHLNNPQTGAILNQISQPQQNTIITPQTGNLGFTPPDPKEVERKIREGFTAYGNGKVPATIEPFIQQMVQATQTNPFWAANPYLLPQHTILETSAGQNITRPNNVMNWGVTYPGNNELFAKMTPAQVFNQAITGIGSRDPNYESFRTGKTLSPQELQQYANKFEPANDSYYNNLSEGVKFFQNQK